MLSINYAKLRKIFIFCVVGVALFNTFLIIKLADQPTLRGPWGKSQTVRNSVSERNTTNTTYTALEDIHKYIQYIDSLNVLQNPSYFVYLESLLQKQNHQSNKSLWDVATKWVTKDQIVPNFSPLLPSLLDDLKKRPIEKAGLTKKGTQLKIFLHLEGGQPALFKPKWYEPNEVIEGSVYSGKDRFHGEIIAFHIGRLLCLNRVPIVAPRILNVNKEIFPVASPQLNQTFLNIDGNICLYGVCYHCKKEDPVCGDGHMLEGSITLWLPDQFPLKKHRHPWQRTYNSKHSLWEVEPNYCFSVRKAKYLKDPLLLDLIEASVFDFLIDNGDRHHFEVFHVLRPRVLLIDNGKSFGNPYVDHVDILAPLYQCCRLRKSFASILVSLRKAGFSKWLKKMLHQLDLERYLPEAHLAALDRRLDKALAVVATCLHRSGRRQVLVT